MENQRLLRPISTKVNILMPFEMIGEFNLAASWHLSTGSSIVDFRPGSSPISVDSSTVRRRKKIGRWLWLRLRRRRRRRRRGPRSSRTVKSIFVHSFRGAATNEEWGQLSGISLAAVLPRQSPAFCEVNHPRLLLPTTIKKSANWILRSDAAAFWICSKVG